MKAKVELSIDEMWELKAYNKRMAEIHLKNNPDTVMASGKTSRFHAEERMRRYHELDRILEETWPK